MKTHEELRVEVREFLQTLKLDEDTIKKGIDLVFKAGDINFMGTNTFDATDPKELKDIPAEMRAYVKKLPMEEKKEFYWKISHNFDARLYPKIKEFVKQLEKLNEAALNEWVSEEEKKESYLEEQRGHFEVYDHDLYRGEIVVYTDCIHAKSYYYQEDFISYIPSCGEYIDNGTWRYPLSRLKEFKPSEPYGFYSGMPVLYESPEVDKMALKVFNEKNNSNKLTRVQVADKIRTIIYSMGNLPTMVNVNGWAKHGKVRLYIEDSDKEKLGYIDITLTGANYDKIHESIKYQIVDAVNHHINWTQFQIEDIEPKVPSWMQK